MGRYMEQKNESVPVLEKIVLFVEHFGMYTHFCRTYWRRKSTSALAQGRPSVLLECLRVLVTAILPPGRAQESAPMQSAHYNYNSK